MAKPIDWTSDTKAATKRRIDTLKAWMAGKEHLRIMRTSDASVTWISNGHWMRWMPEWLRLGELAAHGIVESEIPGHVTEKMLAEATPNNGKGPLTVYRRTDWQNGATNDAARVFAPMSQPLA